MITKTIPISASIVINYTMKQDISFWVFWRFNGNWDGNMIRISQATVEQILASEERERDPREQDCDSHSQGSE